MTITITADPSPGLLARLDAVEEAADALFRARGIHFPAPAVDVPRAAGYFAIASEGIPPQAVGFAHVIEEEGLAHLEQLSVHPDHARQGHGRALVEAALSEAAKRGYEHLTLSTYAEIPWNRPFYESCGFRVIAAPEAPFFTRILFAEEKLGLSAHGPRVLMRARTSASPSPSRGPDSGPTG